MADQIKHKSPQELGEAVGRKIEELFGGMFGDEESQATEAAPSSPPQAAPAGKTAPPPGPSAPGAPSGPGRSAGGGNISAPGGSREDPGKAKMPFEDLVERAEALILSMEWEVSPDSATELSARFKEMEPLMPASGPARNILAMNARVLARCNAPEAIPHPALNKFFQQSVTGLRSIYESQGKRPLGQDLIDSLTKGYKQIMAAPVVAKPTPESGEPAQGSGRDYGGLLEQLGNSIRSLGEAGQRLSRILGALRQGGEMSREEMRRRLGTLEGLLSDRMDELSSYHKALAQIAPPMTDGSTAGTSAEGILMVVWEGMPLAIPASAVAALFPLNKAQAEQFVGKSTVTLGSHQVQRLPLKKPAGSDQRATSLPSWFVRLAWGGKDCFLVADRSLGYRRTPEGVDLLRDKQIKIGATTFAVLKLAAFR
ncbi:MAG: hypothetical protein HY913_21305 [Desulfomonile tiedjei]|nr:hypothetical protein [Desulfomonile tiedjei]